MTGPPGHPPSHYQILEVQETASPEVIRAAWRYLSQHHHPDKNPGDRARCEARMRAINEAYRVLADPERRRHYDRTLARQRTRPRPAPAATPPPAPPRPPAATAPAARPAGTPARPPGHRPALAGGALLLAAALGWWWQWPQAPGCGEGQTTGLVRRIAAGRLPAGLSRPAGPELDAIREQGVNRFLGTRDCAALLVTPYGRRPVRYTVELSANGDAFFVSLYGL